MDEEEDEYDEDEEDEGFVPEARDASLVAKRLVVLVLVADLADSIVLERHGAVPQAMATRKGVFDHLVVLGLSPDDLESAERDLAEATRTGAVDSALVL